MKSVNKIFISFVILAFTYACKKGGTGGNTNIVTIVSHHGKAIKNARVFIKYGAYNFPGIDTTIYNSKQLSGADGYTNFKNLKPGYYFCYAIGYDSTSATQVSGNAGLKIKQKDKGSELELRISVSE